MTNIAIQLVAYKLIRREVRKFDRSTSDAELGNYVRGVVDMQTELFMSMDTAAQEDTQDGNELPKM